MTTKTTTKIYNGMVDDEYSRYDDQKKKTKPELELELRKRKMTKMMMTRVMLKLCYNPFLIIAIERVINR